MVRTFAVGVVLLAVGVLSGCGGTTDAGPPPAPATTPSASATPPPPAMPDAARQHTKAGAVAFVRHYVDLINHAQATGETQALKAVEDPQCLSCRSVRSHLRALYARGGSITSGAWQVASAPHVSPNPDIQGFTVEALIRTSAQIINDGSGHVKRVRGGSNILTFLVKRFGRSWRVSQWSRAV